MKLKITNYPVAFFIFAMILSLPAYLINLGLQPFIDDESIRALVAFEMLQKGDFITPTVGGEIYLKKPPLFNWLVALSFEIFNDKSELPVRIPMIFSLYLYVLAIFHYFRKELSTEMGVINALMFLTCGRILIYESQYGLIDTTFSFLTFLFFMLIYKAFNEGKLLKLFILAYLLTALSFLLKGLPSVVFLVITLLVLFVSQKKFKLLLNWRHFVGIIIFLLITGTYYYLYFTRNHVQPENMLSVMFGETTRRTALRFGIIKTIIHFFSFPFEMGYHFLPWTLLTVALFSKGIFRKIRANPFLFYVSLVFVFNIIVYWTSPEVYPRYILMLIPLYFCLISYFYLRLKGKPPLALKIVEVIFGTVMGLTALASLAPLIIELPPIPHVTLVSIVLFMALSVITILFFRQKKFRIYWLAIAMLVFRIGFDLVVIPVRLHNSDEVKAKETALSIAEQTRGHKLYYWWNPKKLPDKYYGKRLTTYRFTYYLSLGRDQIIYVTSKRDPDAYYITPGWNVKGEHIKIIREFQPAGHESSLILFKFIKPEPNRQG